MTYITEKEKHQAHLCRDVATSRKTSTREIHMHGDRQVMPELAEAIGPRNAITLCLAIGGAHVYVPQVATRDHVISWALGTEVAQKVCDIFAGETIDVPSKRSTREVRNRMICQEYRSMPKVRGGRANHLAAKYGLTYRQIINITGADSG